MITVLLVDDHDLVRAGVKSLLSGIKDIQVVGEASNGEEALKIAREKRPHVVLMEVRMPGIGGIEATRKLIQANSQIKIIALTMCDEEPFPSKMLKAGATGYLTKKSRLDELVGAIYAVHLGKSYLSPAIAQQLALKNTLDENTSLFDALSSRELQVMLMITSGQKVQNISDKLCLSPKTVNTYRYRLFEKLKVHSDVALTHFAIRHGIADAALYQAT